MDYPFIVCLDTNVFYPPQKKEKIAADELRKFMDGEEISYEICETVEQELSKAPERIARQRLDQIVAYSEDLTNDERNVRTEIRKMLFGEKESLKPNELNDIDLLFQAQRYACRYLVTVDRKHILSKISRIAERFNIVVLLPSDCLEMIKGWFESHSTESKHRQTANPNSG